METIVRCMKGLGDENRLRILMLLMARELCVCQIMAVLAISQPLVSRHLAVLKAAGLVRSRRDGKLIFYSISEQARSGGKIGLMQVVKGALVADPVILRDALRLAESGDLNKVAGTCKPARAAGKKV